MKKINLIINSLDDKNEPLKVKSFTVQGKLYFWERVEIEITNLVIENESLVRAALYDEDVQVAFATEFSRNDDGNLICVLVLRTQALSDALAETKPNRAKNFTFYFWNGYQEEVSFVGNIPIYQNPYIQDEYGPEITVDANILVQYSVHGDDWSDEVEEGTRYIRFSMDKGTTWGDGIFLGALVDEIKLLDPNKTVVIAEGGKLPAIDGSLLTNLPAGTITVSTGLSGAGTSASPLKVNLGNYSNSTIWLTSTIDARITSTSGQIYLTCNHSTDGKVIIKATDIQTIIGGNDGKINQPHGLVVLNSQGKIPESLYDKGSGGGGSVTRNVYTLSLSNPVIPEGSPITEFTVTGRAVHIKINAGTSLIMGKIYLVDTTDATDCVEVMIGSKFIPDGDGFAYVYDVNLDEAVDFETNNLMIQTLG